jgi:hypothetical protein
VRQRLKRVRLVILAAVVLVAVGAGAVGLVLAYGGRDAPSCDEVLDRSAWKSDGDARTREAHRLADCNRLIGLSRAEIRRLLGPAQEHDPARDETCFELGPDALGIDSEFLCVVFEGGIVSHTRFFGG